MAGSDDVGIILECSERATRQAWPNERSNLKRRLDVDRRIGETTLDCLGVALDRGELSTAWMRSDRRFDPLRQLPRFQTLLERLNPLEVG